jgi:phosphorylcholine metabolism protein LicD
MAYNKEDNSELRRLQMVELEIMRLFAEICEKHKLRYYIVGGTMLGAVRHKGFIPWDDDMDVGMPRPDYEKFMEKKDMSDLLHEYNSLLVNCDKQVQIVDNDNIRVMKAIGIDEYGRLLVENEEGYCEAVISGEVSVRGLYGYT